MTSKVNQTVTTNNGASAVDGSNAAASTSTFNEVVSFVKSLAVLIAIAFLLRASVVEAFKIPSSSMEPTLEIGDHILVNKLSYGIRLPFLEKTVWNYSQPKRGDIVVFTLPDDPDTSEYEPDTNIIKRVIGLPGDRIEVKGTTVEINGQPYLEDGRYAKWRKGGETDFPLSTVPDGRIFLMGDNRDYSRDARFWKDHFLEISRVKGRAFIIYWSSEYWLRRIGNILR